jgi:predicted dehydrogenase
LRKIKIGILGCASIAERSVMPAFLALDNYFILVAVASRTAYKANKFAEKFNCEACYTYDALIEREDIDAIYIPLPTGLHEEWVNKALNARKHVYAEKSIASDSQQAMTMVSSAKKNNVALMEGFMFQYHEQHKHLKELLKGNIVGEIRYFSSSFGFQPLSPDNFRYDEKIGGGALFDAAAYPLRAAFFILGDDLKIEGASLFRDKKTGASIYGSAYLKGGNGIGASISFGFDNFYQCNILIWGSEGKITVERAFTPKPDFVPTFILENENGKQIINSFADNHFEKALLEFYDIVCNNKKRTKHFKEILQQSAALNKIVELTR